MRTISANALTALEADTIKQSSRVTFYKSRAYFKQADVLGSADTWITDAETAGDWIFSGYTYEVSLSKPLVARILLTNNTIELKLGTNTPVVPTFSGQPLTTDGISRPSLIEDKLYYREPAGMWRSATLNLTLLAAGTAACVTSKAYPLGFTPFPMGAYHPITTTSGVLLALDHGGVRPIFFNASSVARYCQFRFVQETDVFHSDTLSMTWLTNSAAVELDNKIYVYQSMPNGSVKGVKLTLNTDEMDGIWSDIFEAVAQDLSIFRLGNAFVANSKVFLCGEFYRTEQFASDYHYTLLIHSTDGMTFSFDRRCLSTVYNKRFVAFFNDDTIGFYSHGRYYETLAPYQFMGENAPNSTYSIIHLQGQTTNLDAMIAAGDEVAILDPIIQTGTYCKVELGIQIPSGMDWITYQDCVVGAKNLNVSDGLRQLGLNLVADAQWSLSSMTHPFYLELLGKQVSVDRCTNEAALYSLESELSYPRIGLVADMWKQPDGFSVQSHVADNTMEVFSESLDRLAIAFPKLPTNTSLTVKIYGWSRAGTPLAEGDTTPSSSLNDVFRAILHYKDGFGEEFTVYSTAGMLTSTHDHSEQTWHTDAARDGSYPVIYNFPNPLPGAILLRVGVQVISPATGPTVFYIERVEIPEIPMMAVPSSGASGLIGWVFPPFDFDFEIPPFDFDFPITEFTLPEMKRSLIGEGDLNPTGYINLYPTASPHELEVGKIYAVETYGTGGYKIAYGPGDYIWPSPNEVYRDIPYIVGDSSDSYYDQGAGEYWITGPISTSEYPGWSNDGLQLLRRHQFPYALPNIGWVFPIETGETYPHYRIYFRAWSKHAAIIMAKRLLWAGGAWSPSTARPAIDPADPRDDPWPPGAYTHNPPDIYNKYIFWPPEATFHRHATSSSHTYDKTLWTPIGQQTKSGEYKWRLYEINPNEPEDTELIPYWNMILNWNLEFNFPDFGSDFSVLDRYHLVQRKMGLFELLFATTPYSAFNFDTVARVLLSGKYSMAGCLGLAGDQNNFVAGYIRPGDENDEAYLGIMKVRDGVKYILAEVQMSGAGAIQWGTGWTEEMVDVRFTHRNGLFTVDAWLSDAVEEPPKGVMLSYEWQEGDGPLAVVPDIYHVGAFSYLNAPHFRITGHKATSEYLAVLPADINFDNGSSDYDNLFPASGTVKIDGLRYAYTGKMTTVPGVVGIPQGPFQVISEGDWGEHDNFSDGYHYPGIGADISEFKWLDDNYHADDLEDVIFASTDGAAFPIDLVEWRAWTKVEEVIVIERNRCRIYPIDGDMKDFNGFSENKAYLTKALTGVTPLGGDDDIIDEQAQHYEGSYAFLYTGEKTTLLDFYAAAGDPDRNVETLCNDLCRLAGTEAEFAGDTIIDSIALAAPGDEEEIV